MNNAFEAHPLIFVVDDEPSIARMLCVVLQMNLFNAIPHTSAEAALDAAKLTPPEYLISDIIMPGMNGIELANHMRSETPTCKILLFSGNLDAHELVDLSTDAGQNFCFVQKPIHPTQLVAALKSL